MKRGRTLYAIEVETDRGSEVLGTLMFTEEVARKAADDLEKEPPPGMSLRGTTVYEMKVGRALKAK